MAGVGYSALTQTQRDAMPAMASSAMFYGIGVLELIVGALLVWGGLTTMQGKTNRILFFVAAAVVVIAVINIFVGGFISVIGIILPAIILALLWQQPNKQWFLSQGGTTI
jgi:hypothetical protein